MENPIVQMFEIMQQEMQRWMMAVLKGAFNPKIMIDFMSSLGIDMSQLSEMSRQPGFDPYKVLGLDKSAGDEEIKHRYRELLHKLHPDTAGTQGTGFLLQMVMAAHAAIKKERGW